MRQNCAYIIIFGDLKFLGLITVVIVSYRAVQTFNKRITGGTGGLHGKPIMLTNTVQCR